MHVTHFLPLHCAVDAEKKTASFGAGVQRCSDQVNRKLTQMVSLLLALGTILGEKKASNSFQIHT